MECGALKPPHAHPLTCGALSLSSPEDMAALQSPSPTQHAYALVQFLETPGARTCNGRDKGC